MKTSSVILLAAVGGAAFYLWHNSAAQRHKRQMDEATRWFKKNPKQIATANNQALMLSVAAAFNPSLNVVSAGSNALALAANRAR